MKQLTIQNGKATMTNNKTADTQDFLTLLFLGFLILNTVGFFYAKHAKTINTPLVKMSYAILQITAKITANDSVANQVTHLIDHNKLADLSAKEQQAINQAAGYYSKYILLVYGIIGIIYINQRPGPHRYTKTLTLQKLIEHNVKQTPCLAPIVYRDPTKRKYQNQFITAQTPIQFALKHKLLVNQQTGEALKKSEIYDNNNKINSSSLLLQSNSPILLLKDPLKTIAAKQLGTHYKTDIPPTYIKGLWTAFDLYQENPKKAQHILDQLSLRFLNKKKIEQIDLTLTAVEKAFKNKREDIQLEPINLALARKLKSIQPEPLSTNQFIWLRMIDRTLWYSLNQVGSEVYWSEAFSVGLALDYEMNDLQQIADIMHKSIMHEIRAIEINIASA